MSMPVIQRLNFQVFKEKTDGMSYYCSMFNQKEATWRRQTEGLPHGGDTALSHFHSVL
jgi:hypothetical protein